VPCWLVISVRRSLADTAAPVVLRDGMTSISLEFDVFFRASKKAVAHDSVDEDYMQQINAKLQVR